MLPAARTFGGITVGISDAVDQYTLLEVLKTTVAIVECRGIYIRWWLACVAIEQMWRYKCSKLLFNLEISNKHEIAPADLYAFYNY